MADYILSCDTAADMQFSRYEELGLLVKKLHYEIDGKRYEENPAVFDPKEFYAAVDAAKEVRTGGATVEEYLKYFEELLKSGQGIIHVALSSALSEQYSKASGAAVILKMVHPELRIRVIDSLCASGGEALLLKKAAQLRDDGYSMDELAEWIEANKLRVNHLFYVTDLSQLIRMNRVTEAQKAVADRLGIYPVLRVNSWGEIVPRKSVRGEERAIKKVVSYMRRLAERGTRYDGEIIITNSDCAENANRLRDAVQKSFSSVTDICIDSIGAAIGLHTGRECVALFFWGKERTV